MSNEELDPRESFTVTFEIVGPITVSTLDEKDPDPREAVLEDLSHWTWSCKLQIRRFFKSFEATQKPEFKSDLNRRRRFSRLSYDKHMVLVAAANLNRALKEASTVTPDLKLTEDLRVALVRLRDVYEHWNEHRTSFRQAGRPKSRAGKNLHEEFPSAAPWSFEWHPGGDVVVAGVVSLRAFLGELEILDQGIRKRQKGQASGAEHV